MLKLWHYTDTMVVKICLHFETDCFARWFVSMYVLAQQEQALNPTILNSIEERVG